jgi:hypothetical protein
MTSIQVRIKGHTEIVKMLQGLEATNQNGELYMRAALRAQGSKGDPPTELLKNYKKKFGKHVFIIKFFCRYKTKMKGALKITKLKRHCAALY